MKPRLAISFSGGRSSAVMLKRCLDLYDETHEISIVFANTGCEHEETLRFVDAVNRNFADGRVVWVEAEFHELGKGPTAKIVDFESASRNGEPFEAAIAKHGIFCTTHFKYCEQREKKFFNKTGFTVNRDRRNGETNPYPLFQLRKDVESGRDFGNEWRSTCGCMTLSEEQA